MNVPQRYSVCHVCVCVCAWLCSCVQVQAQSQVPVEVLGSWSMPSEKQEGLDSFLRDLRTIFPQGRWLQVSREVGKTGFSCQLLPLALGEGGGGIKLF